MILSLSQTIVEKLIEIESCILGMLQSLVDIIKYMISTGEQYAIYFKLINAPLPFQVIN